MEHIRMLTRDIIPCWYELSWAAEHKGVILRVHKDFIRDTPPLSDEAPIIKSYQKQFKFGTFNAGFDRDFGFDGAFLHLGEKDGFVEFFVKLPAFHYFIDKPCERCEGTGKDKFDDGECLKCGGNGLEHRYEWQELRKVSACFSVFLMLAHYPEVETTAQFPQLMTVRTITDSGMHGGSLDGEYSLPLARWLASLPENYEIPEMTMVMRQAWEHMNKLSNMDAYQIWNSIASEHGWLNVNVPGDACGLHPAHGGEYDMEDGWGYKFGCHNVDRPDQQLCLLAGLAALHDRARKEINEL